MWVDDSTNELVIQGWKPGPELEADCAAFRVPGHAAGIPQHEAVVRIPARMVPAPRKACDAAERAQLIRRTVARGVAVRRARIVSEPVSDYIRYEHASTVVNLGAGQQARWLARRRASDIALPGNDFWLIDGRLIRWNHFTGDGASAPGEISEDPAAAKLCAEAFEAVWTPLSPSSSAQA